MSSDVVDVILRGGETLRLRPPRETDTDEILEFFGALSERSLYLRFHGFPRLGPEVAEQLVDPNWRERGALVGTFLEDGRERIVAVANYVRLRDPAVAEAAFAVADELPAARHRDPPARATRDARRERGHRADRGRGARRQPGDARGVRGARFRAVPRAGRRRGRDRVPDQRRPSATRRASTSATTSPSRRLSGRSSSRAPSPSSARRDVAAPSAESSSVTCSRPTSSARRTRSTATGGGRRRARVHVDRGRSRMRSTSPSSACRREPCSTPPRQALAAWRRARSSSSPRASRRPATRARSARSSCSRSSARTAPGMIGPNCLGISVAGPRLNATFAGRAASARKHRILVAERRARSRPARGRRHAGARALRVRLDRKQGGRLDERPARVVGGGRGDGGRSCSTSSPSGTLGGSAASPAGSRAGSRSSRSRAGRRRAGQRAASSHTAALAGSEAAVDALFRQAGVIRASSLEELIDAAALLSSQPLPHRPPVAHPHERGRAGDPLRRRVRVRRARSCRRWRTRLARRCRPSCPPRPASRTPSTCSAAPRRRATQRRCPLLLGDARVDAVIVLFVPPVTRDCGRGCGCGRGRPPGR